MVSHDGSKSLVPFLMLLARTVFFGLFQVLFVILFSVSWVESIVWWPFYAILANLICFFILKSLARREGKTYLDIINFNKSRVCRDLKAVWWVLIIGGVVGGIGLNGVAFLMYGSFLPPDNMIQPLTLWAAFVGLILFPITNALVEVPVYMGYCFPRFELRYRSKWIALSLSAFFLAFQHFTLPITVNDFPFMVWHFVSMIPLAFAVGLIYMKIRSLLPIMIVHYVFDVMAILGLFMVSI